MQFSEIFTAKRCGSQLGLRTYFILKPGRFVTTAIFTGSASTVHNSFKVAGVDSRATNRK